MPQYLGGTEALADARLRLDGLPPSAAVLMLEGRDDFLIFADRSRSLNRLVVCGNKKKLLEAYAAMAPTDAARIVFVTDCDYDVPCGALRPAANLLVTRHADIEMDLIDAGRLRAVVLRAIPRARESDAAANEITADVTTKAIALGEVAGQLRHVSAVRGLGLSFDGLELRRFRDKQSKSVRVEQLVHAVHQRSAGSSNMGDLSSELAAAPSGLTVCRGKDVSEAVRTVIHQDYGLSLNNLTFVEEYLRTVDDSSFEQLDVVRRLRRWESTTGRTVLR